jgi:hypothetical protein
VEPLSKAGLSERLAMSARHTVLLIGTATLALDLRVLPAMPIPVTPDGAQSAVEKNATRRSPGTRLQSPRVGKKTPLVAGDR